MKLNTPEFCINREKKANRIYPVAIVLRHSTKGGQNVFLTLNLDPKYLGIDPLSSIILPSWKVFLKYCKQAKSMLSETIEECCLLLEKRLF
jgi:hypothetical protein